MIPALLLTAGHATRLRPLSLVRAKAAFPIAGEPIARRLLRWLAAAGVPEAILNLHHLPATLTATIGDGLDLGIRVRYAWESPVLGSAGGPTGAARLWPAHDTFFIVNGDTLSDVDLRALHADHASSGALVTMAAVPNRQPEKYGGLVINDAGQVVDFVRRGSTRPSWHFVGVQVAAAAAFASVPPATPYESVATLYPALLSARPGAIRLWPSSTEFFDIGTPADYLATHARFSAREPHHAAFGAGTRVDASARVERSAVWNDVVIGADAVLRECVVTDGVAVPAGTSWQGVGLRVATNSLEPGELRIGDLAVSPIVTSFS